MMRMHAIRLYEHGPADNLHYEELPDLSPAEGQVRIAVEVSGVHLLDTSLRRGEPGPMPSAPLPTIPGREVAGVIDSVGSGVDQAWVGRRVVAHLGPVPGGYADQAVTDVANLIRVPDQVRLTDATAALGTGRTALGILELEPPQPDDIVLVPSAAGGLGWLLVQSALKVGAQVVAAAGGPERTAALADLGATYTADYSQPGWDGDVRERFGGITVV